MKRHDEREAQISLPATISAYLGVTEPALFGVNVKYVYPFVAGMIGSSIAGLLSVTFNITANAIGIGGLPGILSIQAKYMIPFVPDPIRPAHPVRRADPAHHTIRILAAVGAGCADGARQSCYSLHLRAAGKPGLGRRRLAEPHHPRPV